MQPGDLSGERVGGDAALEVDVHALSDVRGVDVAPQLHPHHWHICNESTTVIGLPMTHFLTFYYYL